ncbi:MAG: DUF2202 domain-containing protein [Candidatus Thiodiazotropha sp.]
MFYRLIFIALLSLTVVTASQAGWRYGGARDGQGQNQHSNQNRSQALSVGEAEQLRYLREEEKLARDVYQALYQRWNLIVFDNIAQAEQRHMDAVLGTLNQYALVDPGLSQAGLFSNQELQSLYDRLVDEGAESPMAALRVGALIEEVDMQDLDTMIATTEKEDLIGLYDTLHCGSRNHLRAFVRQIESRGQVYTAQVMSQESVDLIVDSPMERRCGWNR